MPRLAILWHLAAVPSGNHSFQAIAQAVKNATQAGSSSTFKAYAGGFDLLSVFQADEIKAELASEGIDLRSFTKHQNEQDIERAIVCDVLAFGLACATERVAHPVLVLVVPDPSAYLGPIEVLRSNKFNVTLVLAKSQVFPFANHADQLLVWDDIMRPTRPPPSLNATSSPAAPAAPLPLPPGLPQLAQAAVNGLVAAQPTADTPAAADWEVELNTLLDSLSTHAPAPVQVQPPLDTPEPSPEMSRSQGFVWDLSTEDVRRRRAAAVGTAAWHARLDQASPPRAQSELSEPARRARWDAGGASGEVNKGGWEDALSAIARQANSPRPHHLNSTGQSSLSRLTEAQQQVGNPSPASSAPAQPISTDWLDTLLSESASLAASKPASSGPFAATPASNGASPGPASPWVTVTRGAKQPGAYEEEKARLFGPLIEAIKVVGEQTGQRKVTRGLVGSELHPTRKAKARFYDGLPGIENFRDYTRAAEREGLILLRQVGDRDTIELAPQRQPHGKSQSLHSGVGGRQVPGLGVSWKSAGKIARGGAR